MERDWEVRIWSVKNMRVSVGFALKGDRVAGWWPYTVVKTLHLLCVLLCI